ncbi:hypothetical protein [Amnibacterium kyonggiense]
MNSLDPSLPARRQPRPAPSRRFVLGAAVAAAAGAGITGVTLIVDQGRRASGGSDAGDDLRGRLFAADSPWNTRIGTGAVYAAESTASTAAILRHAGGASINSATWSVPVVVASESAPLVSIAVAGGRTSRVRLPQDARPSSDSDAELALVDGDRSYEYWGLQRSLFSWSARASAEVDLNAAGTTGGIRASGFSLLGGLIRKHEMGSIDHALVIALTADQLRLGPVWPAATEDSDAASSYHGVIPMGSLLAIPADADLEGSPLSAAGRALAKALQTYGAYVGDRADSPVLYAEESAEGGALAAMRDDFRSTLAPLLRVVTNSSRVTPGGPGARLAS